MNKNDEYITHLVSLNDNSLNEKINSFNRNLIDFSELENFAVDNNFMSQYNYLKVFKIGKILKNASK